MPASDAANGRVAIDVEGLTKSFGGKVVVRNLSMRVMRGQIYGFLGPNGSGKTTTLRMLCGLLTPDSGRGTALGYDIRTQSDEIKRHVGYMTQRFSLYQDLSIIENLEFVAGAYRLETGAARARIEELVEIAQLGEARDRLARHLSGGMRQKLGVAMAMLSAPELLVFDEPTTGLDPVSRLEIWSLLTRSAREGRALVVTTAYVDEAHRGDSVLALDEGGVIAEANAWATKVREAVR